MLLDTQHTKEAAVEINLAKAMLKDSIICLAHPAWDLARGLLSLS